MTCHKIHLCSQTFNLRTSQPTFASGKPLTLFNEARILLAKSCMEMYPNWTLIKVAAWKFKVSGIKIPSKMCYFHPVPELLGFFLCFQERILKNDSIMFHQWINSDEFPRGKKKLTFCPHQAISTGGAHPFSLITASCAHLSRISFHALIMRVI